MADKFEYYDTGADDEEVVYLAHWRGQTFTPLAAHKITSVKLPLFREGNPSTLTITIETVDGSGHPSGSILCSGTIDGNTFTTNSAGTWYEITLGAGADLDAATQYAIVAKCLGGDVSNRVKWKKDASSPTYPRGAREWSMDSGVNWTTSTAIDCLFEDWGEAIAVAGRSFGFIIG